MTKHSQALVRDLEDPARGILDGHELAVEARFGTVFRSLLHSRGWVDEDRRRRSSAT